MNMNLNDDHNERGNNHERPLTRYVGALLMALVILATFGLAAALDDEPADVADMQRATVDEELARQSAEMDRQRVLYAQGCRPPCTLDDVPASHHATAPTPRGAK